MSGNSFGRIFRVTTFGESHGPYIGAVVDGVPPGLEISESYINEELARRRPGQSSITTGRREEDKVEIISGVIDGKTTGMPVTLLIRNRDVRSKDYESIRDVYRPGHADYGYIMRYGLRDWRGGGRSSGRETAARVAAGAVAKIILKEYGVKIIGYTRKIGRLEIESIDYSFIEENILRVPDREKVAQMINIIEEAKKSGDSVGGEVEVIVKGVPAGIGDPVFDKIEALLAHGIMSIGAIKSFEVGVGKRAAEMLGSEYNDEFINDGGKIKTRTNNAGGILGGITTGEDIVLRCAVRPTGSISIKQRTVDVHGRPREIEIEGRHDPCIVPRIVPVVEAMVAMVVVDCIMMRKALPPAL